MPNWLTGWRGASTIAWSSTGPLYKSNIMTLLVDSFEGDAHTRIISRMGHSQVQGCRQPHWRITRRRKRRIGIKERKSGDRHNPRQWM